MVRVQVNLFSSFFSDKLTVRMLFYKPEYVTTSPETRRTDKEEFNQIHCTHPVSYTHLDVYKRQVYCN